MKKWIFLSGALILLLVLLWVFWPARPAQNEYAAVPQVKPAPRDVVLYFEDTAGRYLISAERQIAGCNDERQCIAQVIEALAVGTQQLIPVIPQRTRVLDVDIEKTVVRVNFSREFVDRHPGGSLSELLTVYGVANTLEVNFPDLRQLQILIAGQIEPTLKGHVDISRPITADFRYSHAPKALGESARVPAPREEKFITETPQ